MGQRHAQLFESLRRDLLDRLVEVRGSLDHAYARMPEAAVRPQLEALLEKMQGYLATQDLQSYRSSAASHMAMRVGEGFAPENVIHSVIAIGDVAVQTAQTRLANHPDCAELVLAITRLNFIAARTLVGLVADDVRRRSQQRDLLGAGHHAGPFAGPVAGQATAILPGGARS
jgi:hypothetical protein